MVYICTLCGAQKTETIPVIPHTHSFTWKTVSGATISAPEKQKGTCSICKAEQTRDYGTKLKATIKLNVKSITLQKKQTTTKVKLTVTLKSGKKATLKVKVQSAKVKTTKLAGLKTKLTVKKGTATITVKSGKVMKRIKVTVR